MQLHLLGGFLGSGKTTAIVNATHHFIDKGYQVGIVTNDKGRHLVDTAFFKSAQIPTAEVPGGCFRCNFGELENKINELKTTAKPDIIFAESVGSCVDMVATVLQPLLELKELVSVSSFSVFADARLLRLWLQGETLPFSEQIVYIFEQQIAEAGLLVINKIDLLSQSSLTELKELAQKQLPDKQIIYQSALTPDGLHSWCQYLEKNELPPQGQIIHIDYEKYDHGSKQLAWLDENITLVGNHDNLTSASINFMSHIYKTFATAKTPIGHLKFHISDNEHNSKISFTSMMAAEPTWQEQIQVSLCSPTTITINGRVQIKPDELNQIIADALEDTAEKHNISYTRSDTTYFQPGIISTTTRRSNEIAQ